jgi:hypothetical protein
MELEFTSWPEPKLLLEIRQLETHFAELLEGSGLAADLAAIWKAIQELRKELARRKRVPVEY